MVLERSDITLGYTACHVSIFGGTNFGPHQELLGKAALG
jgi:hypothetical protein